MEFWGAVLKGLVSLLVFFWEEILFGLIEWARHQLKDGNDPKTKKTH